MMSTSLSQSTRVFLETNAPALANSPTVVGLDGFVDTILHVVDKRLSATEYRRIEGMAEYAGRIADAAGLSMNFELVTQMLKLGGNGPIMANALLQFGAPLQYIGILGHPNIHPVFQDFAGRSQAISIAEPGYTDAIEFVDGKLMMGKHESLKEVNWANLQHFVPAEHMHAMFSEAALIALVNWTMLPFMTDIFRNMLDEVVPDLPGDERWIFFDLADPAKRTTEDIAEALELFRRFEQSFKVVLGLNFNESREIGRVLGLPSPEMEHEAVAAHAAAIRESLNIHTVVVHPSRFASAADAGGTASVEGPYTESPRITTGAGDHFNAGFCMGRMLGGDLATSLQIGVATSGYYVREAASPSIDELMRFLAEL